MPSEPLSESFSSVADVFSGGASSAVATAALSPLSAASLRGVRVRGVRCDISVLLNAGLLYAPPFYAFTRAAISRASFFENENFPLMNLGMNNRARKLS
jgi:hypothetical protein